MREAAPWLRRWNFENEYGTAEPDVKSSAEKHIKTRVFEFKNCYETMAFANGVAWIANKEDHHPDLHISYQRCEVRFYTHAINGLTENDFICAAKIDRLID